MRKYIALLALLLLPTIAYSSGIDSYALSGDVKQTQLNEKTLWYKTQSLDKNPTFEELKRLQVSAENVKTTLGARGAYLTKIKLTNSHTNNNNSNDTWFVNISAVYLDVGTAYWQSDSGSIIPLENFGQLGSKSPRLAHSQAFSLPLNSEESGTLWIYIQAELFATPAIIKIYNKSEFYSKQFLVNSITSISFAVMMTLALIALFVYFRTWYLVTLACAGYIGIQGIGWFLASGSLGHLLSVSTYNPVYIGMVIFPLAIASASQFTKLLFNCRQNHPRLNSAFNLLSIICLMIGVTMPFLSFPIGFVISHIIAVIWIPLCIGTGVYMLAAKDFRAKYYLIGNALYTLSLTGYVLSHLYHLQWDISFEVVVQVALTIDCICILLSLTEWLQIQQKEFRRSYTISRIDPLTQIGNRFAQNERLANISGHYCITFIDLDGFKKINDNLGHDEGDKILVEAASVIKNKLHGLGSVYRCGGDEFILVVEIDCSQQVDPLLIQLSELLLNAEKELQAKGWQEVGLSFGIATSFETLNQSGCLTLADQRMYQYKQAKRQDNK